MEPSWVKLGSSIWGFDSTAYGWRPEHPVFKISRIQQVNPDILKLRPPGWRYSGREHTITILRESNEGAAMWLPPSQRALPSSGLLDLAHWIENMCACGPPLIVVRRPDGRDFLHWRISEMKSSANPAPCAPGSHGPPAYCDSLHSASFSRTLQLILGQPISSLLQPIILIDCLCCFDCYKSW